ncbi:MAG: hypothetical protein MSG64_20865 [Pyrinomonadaceae bacterium MAG19_C2-C3]|nr:hypothetical protein [Pyrinomonadaceae bacterium MAG19_C2-C3]
MIEEGRLKALKIGRDYVISPDALDGITRQPAGRPPKAKPENLLPTNGTTTRTITDAAKKDGKK